MVSVSPLLFPQSHSEHMELLRGALAAGGGLLLPQRRELPGLLQPDVPRDPRPWSSGGRPAPTPHLLLPQCFEVSSVGSCSWPPKNKTTTLLHESFCLLTSATRLLPPGPESRPS